MTNDVIKKKRFPGSGSDFGGLTRGFRLTRVSRPLVLFLIQSAGFLNRKCKTIDRNQRPQVSISSAYDKSRCKKEEKLFAPDISTDLFYGRDDFNCFTCLVKDKSRSQTILVSPMQLREEKRFPEDVTLHCFPR